MSTEECDIILSFHVENSSKHAKKLEKLFNNAGYTVLFANENIHDIKKSMETLGVVIVCKEYEESDVCEMQHHKIREITGDLIIVQFEDFKPKLFLTEEMRQRDVFLLNANYLENVKKMLNHVDLKIFKNRDLEDSMLSFLLKQSRVRASPGSKLNKFKISIHKLFMRLIDSKFSGRFDDGKIFAHNLLPEDDEVVMRLFSDVNKFDHPVLDAICYRYYELEDRRECDLLEIVNEALAASNFRGKILTGEDVLKKLLIIELSETSIDFSEENIRKDVYKTIANEVGDSARMFAHFLLDYKVVKEMQIDRKPSSREMVLAVLNKWDCTVPQTERTWASIRQVLWIMRKLRVLRELEMILGD